jgi:hypothetical protein
MKTIPIITESAYNDKGKTVSLYNDAKTIGYVDNAHLNPDVKMMLESKRQRIGEVEICLFENCDIVCSFCQHDKNSIIGMTEEEIFSKIDISINFANSRKNSIDHIIYNIVGGEIFQDGLMDEYLPIYTRFLFELNKRTVEIGLSCEMVLATNLLFKDTDGMTTFLEGLAELKINYKLGVSYDITGRPINSTYKNNVITLKDYITSCCVVGTKSTLTKLIAGETKFFDTMYNMFPIYLDDYIPDPGFEAETPKDSLKLAAYKYIVEKYPKMDPVARVMKMDSNHMSCMSLAKISIMPDNSVSNCKWHRYKNTNFHTYKNDPDAEIYLDTAPQMRRFMEVKDCMGCEFYKKCPLTCFTQWDFVYEEEKHDTTDCWQRMFFQWEQTR